MLQMFIAVINENFRVAEEAKRVQQADLYFRTQEPDRHMPAWVRKLNPYRWFKPSPRAIHVENFPSNLVLPMPKAFVQDLPVPERRPSRVSLLPTLRFCVLSCLIRYLVLWIVGPLDRRQETCIPRREQVTYSTAEAVHR